MLSWKDPDITHYKDTMQLLESAKVEMFEDFGDNVQDIVESRDDFKICFDVIFLE